MAGYRLYFMDRAGHIRDAVDLECIDDEDAIRKVADHADGHSMELWRRARRVMEFPAPAET